MADEKDEKKGESLKAIIDAVVTYQCPDCGTVLGNNEEETELNEKNSYRIEIKAEAVTCSVCNKEVTHDPIVITTIKKR